MKGEILEEKVRKLDTDLGDLKIYRVTGYKESETREILSSGQSYFTENESGWRNWGIR